MIKLKSVLLLLVLCLVHGIQSKPTEHNLSESRGIGSTVWGWITYPFSWWSSEDVPPVSDQLIASTTYGPFDDIEVGKHNVTVWCNDQTCTTMKCDKHGCRNNTCNIYDTDLSGECREYHITVDEENQFSQPTQALPKPDHNDITSEIVTSTEISSTSTKPELSSTQPSTVDETNKVEAITVESAPLELEAVLSSTVTEDTVLNQENKSRSKKM